MSKKNKRNTNIGNKEIRSLYRDLSNNVTRSKDSQGRRRRCRTQLVKNKKKSSPDLMNSLKISTKGKCHTEKALPISPSAVELFNNRNAESKGLMKKESNVSLTERFVKMKKTPSRSKTGNRNTNSGTKETLILNPFLSLRNNDGTNCTSKKTHMTTYEKCSRGSSSTPELTQSKAKRQTHQISATRSLAESQENRESQSTPQLVRSDSITGDIMKTCNIM